MALTKVPKDMTDIQESPAFTGTPTAPTASPGTSTTQLATTEFVQAATASTSSSSSLPYNWSMTTMPASANYGFVLFDGSKFIALTNVSTLSLVFSYDGKSWLSFAPTGLPASVYSSLRFLNGTYFATNFAGTTTTSLYSTTNPNGTWTARTVPVAGVIDIAYGSSKYVIATQTGIPKRLYYSSDATTWTLISTLTASYSSITYTGSKFVAIGTTSGVGKYVATSIDGVSWTESLISSSTIAHTVLKSGNGIIVGLYYAAIATADPCIYSVDGGATWSTSPLAGLYWQDIVYEPVSKNFIAVAEARYSGLPSQVATIGVTKDFVSWKYSAAPAGSGGQVFWKSLAVGNGVIAGVAEGGTAGAGNRAMVSSPLNYL